MEVQVEILIQTITAQCGTLNPGDTLRTNVAFADHLVHDCQAARYMPAPGSAVADVQMSAQADPYPHLGTLIAVVPGAAADGMTTAAAADDNETVQTSAQSGEQSNAAAEEAPKARKRVKPAARDEES